VLGPLLFIVYSADLADIMDQHGVFIHAFADDTQMYFHCHRDDLQSAAAQLKLYFRGWLVDGRQSPQTQYKQD